MSHKTAISTPLAPQAIGTYSQAIKTRDLLFCSGQIPLDASGNLVEGPLEDQITQIFNNLQAVAEAAGTNLNNAIKLTVFLTNMDDFAMVNHVMAKFFTEPYPARAAVAVKSLPKAVTVEVDAIIQV